MGGGVFWKIGDYGFCRNLLPFIFKMKLIIRVEKQSKFIDEVFEQAKGQGMFSKAQLKVFKVVYKSRVSGLFRMIRSRVSSYITEESDSHFIAEEKGNFEYIRHQKEKFEMFIFGDEKLLNQDKEYKEFKYDRVVNKVLRYIKRGVSYPKDFAIKKALGEGRIFDFFLRSGISITWKIEKNK